MEEISPVLLCLEISAKQFNISILISQHGTIVSDEIASPVARDACIIEVSAWLLNFSNKALMIIWLIQ